MLEERPPEKLEVELLRKIQIGTVNLNYPNTEQTIYKSIYSEAIIL